MVKHLRISAPLQPEQTMFSYVGQLAALNFQPDTTDFCNDMGAPLLELTGGHVESIKKIAELSGEDPERLLEASILRRGPDMFIGDEKLSKATRARRETRFCPQCLMEDIEEATKLGKRRPHLAIYGRRAWLVSQVYSCVHHDIELASVGVGFGPQQYDFFGHVLPLVPQLSSIAATLERRPATDFERYVHGRLNSRGSLWLDELGFSTALRLCEIVGTVIRLGRDKPYASLSPGELRLSGQSGFEVLQHGVPAFRELLSTLQDDADRHARDGANTDFGNIYVWATHVGDPDVEAVLDIMRDHVEETTPVGAGDQVMRRIVKKRKVHSVYTAAREFGIHKDVLRAQLSALGVINDDGSKYHHHLLFPAEPNLQLLERLGRALTAKDGMKHINCERQVWPLLLGKGLIKPICETAATALVFDPADLDAFVGSLTGCVNELPADGLLPINRAARRAQVSQGDVVEYILAGKLKTIGQIPGQEGYSSILVDPAELLALTAKPEIDGMVITKIGSDLGVPHAGLVQMLGKQLPTTWRPYPKMRNEMQRVVDLDVYRAFKEKYVSLRDLSRAAGLNGRMMEAQLKRNGIFSEAGFPPNVHLYLRSRFP
ncbi:TniQ family protein [Devosia sp. LjRoot3]|uniref:TniQ family protein n=1 Tax=Devosia sp. LjRoot3 TaxID=3342319 RepID=UPI003ECD4E88